MKKLLLIALAVALSACSTQPERVETIRYVQVAVTIPADKLQVVPVPPSPTKEETKGLKPAEIYQLFASYIVELHQVADTLNRRLKSIATLQEKKLAEIQKANGEQHGQ